MTDRLPHYVTVEDGQLIAFECGWLYGACHFYPSCQGESWSVDHLAECGPGHEREHHTDCWTKDWFDVDGGCYSGYDRDDFTDNGIPDEMTRSGPIRFWFSDDHLEWEFVDD